MATSLHRAAKRTRPSQRYTSAEFRPYVTALGQLTLAWNDMQQSFAELFSTAAARELPRPGDRVDMAYLHLWNSLQSDRHQRNLLRALLDNPTREWWRPRFVECAKEATNEANRLEDRRNNAVHAPLFFQPASLYGDTTRREKIAPAEWLQHPRALTLAKRGNILTEFRECRDGIISLSDYVRQMNSALANPNRPWPEIHPRQSRPSQSSAQVRRTRNPRARRPPPRSSQA